MIGGIPGLSSGGSMDLGAGPSAANASTTNNMNSGFTGGGVNMGSNNGLPIWLLAAMALGVFIIMLRGR